MVTSSAAKRRHEGNPYEINALGVLQLYGQFVDGDADSTVAIVSSRPISSRARAAIEASAERLGHHAESCAWVTLGGGGEAEPAGSGHAGPAGSGTMEPAGSGHAELASSGNPAAENASLEAASDFALGAHDLLTLLEGLDPVAIIATDAPAVSLVSSAYETPMKMDAANRAACRTVVALSDFDAALDDDDAKRKAWHALKKISRK